MEGKLLYSEFTDLNVNLTKLPFSKQMVRKFIAKGNAKDSSLGSKIVNIATWT
jgi:hypothetical protein